MDDSSSTPTLEPLVSHQQHPAYLLNLPPEVTLELTSYLPNHEIKTLRAVCKYLDKTLLATFGTRYFNRLHLIPTPNSLDILRQISEHPRLKGYVRELRVCASIYQFWGIWQTRLRPGVTWTRPQLRVLSEGLLPYSDASSAEQQSANVCAELVCGGRFQEQLTTALRDLGVEKIGVQVYPRNACPIVLGLKALMKITERDPFEDNASGIWPTWDYETNMVTRMTTIVFSAVRDSGTPLSALYVDKIQLDRLRLPLNLGTNLLHLKHLDLTIGFSDPNLGGSNPETRFDLFTFD
jgi:hypothetical protein